MPKRTTLRAMDARRPVAQGTGAASFGAGDGRYVKLVDYEPGDVLAKVLEVDGADSGLDADTLDGLQGSAFSLDDHEHDDRYFTEDETTAQVAAAITAHANAADPHPGYLTHTEGDNSYSALAHAHADLLKTDGSRVAATAQAQLFAREVGIGFDSGSPRAALDVHGAAIADADFAPYGLGLGVGGRFVNSNRVPLHHFYSSTLPAGYAWAGAPLDGAPSTWIANYANDYLALLSNTAGNRVFLYKPVTAFASNWQNKAMVGRFRTGITTEIGFRFDDGSENTYAEIYLSGVLGNGMQRLDFRRRISGGAVTVVNSAVIVPCGQYLTFRLLSYWSGVEYDWYGYIIGEEGYSINITGFNVRVTSLMPMAGRVGIFAKENTGNFAFCDWFNNSF
jgi:hypothetical protein